MADGYFEKLAFWFIAALFVQWLEVRPEDIEVGRLDEEGEVGGLWKTCFG